MFKSGEMSEQEYAAMSRTLNTGNSWHGELQSKRKDGRFYWERASISPLINDHNEITHFIALKQEITEEKEFQDKLRLASDVFNTAAEAILVTDKNNRI
ncbi:PAS domain-containing protein, partial [Marinomonas gallaica]|uniref:PAS domain-containing protein n=3 Tax=Oceanospirillaceae TaxID=135620 RepID=UPI001E3DEC43